MNARNRIQYDSGNEKVRWVGYFDLLGIKEIIKNKNAISVFVAYARTMEELRKRQVAFDCIECTWFSDSFLIYTADDSSASFTAIDHMFRWLFFFLISGETPVRGSISCSSLYADSDSGLFYGKALIEAYHYGEAQDWINFILCPSAEQQLKNLGIPAEKRLNYAYAKIPYKKRVSELTQNLPACILGQWFIVNNRNTCINNLVKMRDRAIDDGIMRKYTNTIQFIESNMRTIRS